ncbi:hypothetical protein WSM22_20640 [Cytophagales bacterium WSM2-2]|nr:hypothetical protein WSM22_20640 [Cytophagales bacterium WSM2-2]
MFRPIIFFVFFCSALICSAQNEVTRDWIGFQQSVDASFLKKKVKFKVSVSMKVDAKTASNEFDIWVNVENKGGATRFIGYTPKEDEAVTSNEWKTYSIEGTLDETSNKINVGGFCKSNGKFYFDNFELFVENDKGVLQKAILKNGDFETPITGYLVPDWAEGRGISSPAKVKGFTFSTTTDHVHGKAALLVEGKDVQRDTTYIIGPVKGFTPQIGTLVTMLNNMTARVEAQVRNINPKNVDHLFDENANSIGALVMHLAAAEAYYQVYTFENRGFNDAEKEKWQDALDLGEKAREKFKGKDISYYLDQLHEVRKKTIEELRKRNDEWLMEIKPGSSSNTFFSWFHMVEHQSSHLGQIRMIEKRLPKVQEELKETIIIK